MNSQRLANDLRRRAAEEVENCRAYKRVGGIIFDEVSKFIEEKLKSNQSRYSISRKLIAGSAGKNTSLGHNFEPDLDVVLFVRNTSDLPTLQPVSEEFHKILQGYICPGHCRWPTFKLQSYLQKGAGVQFSVLTKIQLPTGQKDVTIEFDLLPAYDFSRDVNVQTRTVLEKIRISSNRSEDSYKYSSSLAEKTVDFVNQQRPFVHYVIRLAKLWDMRLKEDVMRRPGRPSSDSYISGRSSIIELIAIWACRGLDDDILGAFRVFLKLVKSMNKININFSDPNANATQEMTIIDGVNPYHNFAEGLNRSQVVDYMQEAAKTLDALAQVGNAHHDCYTTKLQEFMNKYFATA